MIILGTVFEVARATGDPDPLRIATDCRDRRNLGADQRMVWGDYFFVEALDRVLDSAGHSTARGYPLASGPGPIERERR